jgi:DNA-binding NtrC family response regulator
MDTILIVDDDQMVLTLCCFILRDVDRLEILRAVDGEDAMEVAVRFRGPIHVLLSDIIMPGDIHGIRLARTLTAQRPDMKVVLMSGYNPEQFDLDLDPAWRFLHKPFRPATLLSMVGESLGREVHAGIAR